MKITRTSRFLRSKVFQIICLLVIVIVITAIIVPDQINQANIRQVTRNMTVIMLFACGVCPLLMAGGFDFAGSSFGTITMILFATLLAKYKNVPWPVMMIPTLVLGGLLGYLNSVFIVKLNLVAFIASMAMATVFNGVAQSWTKLVPIQIANTSFNNLSAVFIGGYIPLFFVVAIALIVLYSLMLMKTRFGRSICMCGGNAAAARLAGLNPNRIRTILYVNSGVVAAIGGLIYASQNRNASTAGFAATPHMTAFIGSMVGGVSFWGGSGSIVGAAFGIVLMNLLSYCLVMMGAKLWINSLVNGMLLIVAMSIDDISRRIMLRRLGVKASGGNVAVLPGMSK